MPLSSTDIDSLTASIITDYSLTDYPSINKFLRQAVVRADSELETVLPDDLYNSELGSTLFDQVREVRALCILSSNSSYLSHFTKTNSVKSVTNSAGTRVDMDTSLTSKPPDFCGDYRRLLFELYAINNVIVTPNLACIKGEKYQWDDAS